MKIDRIKGKHFARGILEKLHLLTSNVSVSLQTFTNNGARPCQKRKRFATDTPQTLDLSASNIV